MTRRPTLPLLAGLAAVALATAASATTLYSNSFSSNTSQFSGNGVAIATAPSGETFLGPLSTASGAGTASLTLNTTGYSSLTVNYNVYVIMTEDGDGPAGGNSPTNPDAFLVNVTGGPSLLNYSFANYPGDSQDYPILGSAPQTGASAVNTLGYGNYGDSTYTFTSAAFAATGRTTVINFTGSDNQGLGDEFFGIDNVVVTGVPSVGGVPEPATWGLMLAGFGLAGVRLRRRRAALA